MSHKSRSHRRQPLKKRAFIRRRRHEAPYRSNRPIDLSMFADNTRYMPAMSMLFAAVRGLLRRARVGG